MNLPTKPRRDEAYDCHGCRHNVGMQQPELVWCGAGKRPVWIRKPSVLTCDARDEIRDERK